MDQPRIIRFLDHVSVAFALFAGLAVVILSLLICFDILARTFFRFSLQGTDELGGYTLAVIGSLGLPYALLRRGHPRIDIFLRFFPRVVRAWLHVLAYVAIAGFGLFMTVHAMHEMGETISYGTVTNTPLQTPLALPQGLWVLGTGMFAVVAVACAVHGMSLLRHPRRIEALYGPLTVEEEVNDYVGDAPAAPRL